jgi:hypothetical protein
LPFGNNNTRLTETPPPKKNKTKQISPECACGVSVRERIVVLSPEKEGLQLQMLILTVSANGGTHKIHSPFVSTNQKAFRIMLPQIYLREMV